MSDAYENEAPEFYDPPDAPPVSDLAPLSANPANSPMHDRLPTMFDPSRFLTLVSGKEYLEVKWRLVWLRSEYPDALIHTNLERYEDNEAIFKAVVTLPDGGSATGWGAEDAQGFGDYLEKAETKAIGRALAALGYGTQFCGDFEFGAAAGRVVDSPTNLRPSSSGSSQPYQQSGRPGGGSTLAATDRQTGLIQALAREQKISSAVLNELAIECTGQPYKGITRQNASTLIEYLRENQRRPEAMA